MLAGVDVATQGAMTSTSEEVVRFRRLLGAGVQVPAGDKMNLSLSVRYTLGFTDAFDSADAKNRAWSFLAGLTF